MNKYTVYQINLTEAQHDEVNASDKYPEFYTKYLDTRMSPTADAIMAARDMYQPVAIIEATTPDHVFSIGNIGPFSAIERLAPMHSLSVGDVIVDQDGNAVFVNDYEMEPVQF